MKSPLFSHTNEQRSVLGRREFLRRYHAWPQTPLEQTEQLEQLRILEHGEKLLCVEARHEGVGVDVPADVPQAEEFCA